MCLMSLKTCFSRNMASCFCCIQNKLLLVCLCTWLFSQPKMKHATWLRGHFICDQRRRKIWSNRGKVTDLCSCPHRKHRCCHCCHQLDQKERCVLVLHRPKKGLHPPASGLTGALVESTRSHTAGPAGLLLEMN